MANSVAEAAERVEKLKESLNRQLDGMGVDVALLFKAVSTATNNELAAGLADAESERDTFKGLYERSIEVKRRLANRLRVAGWGSMQETAAKELDSVAELRKELILAQASRSAFAETSDDLRKERDNLQAFKDYVHKYLDGAGVPENPDVQRNATTGCRIECRLDWLQDLVAELRKELELVRASSAALQLSYTWLHDQMEYRMSELFDTLGKQQRKIAEYEEQLNAKDVATYSLEIEDMQQNINSLTQRGENQAQSIQQLRDERDSLQDAVNDLTLENEALKRLEANPNEAMAKQVIHLNEQLHIAQTEYKERGAECDKFIAELREAREHIDTLEKSVEELRETARDIDRIRGERDIFARDNNNKAELINKLRAAEQMPEGTQVRHNEILEFQNVVMIGLQESKPINVEDTNEYKAAKIADEIAEATLDAQIKYSGCACCGKQIAKLYIGGNKYWEVINGGVVVGNAENFKRIAVCDFCRYNNYVGMWRALGVAERTPVSHTDIKL